MDGPPGVPGRDGVPGAPGLPVSYVCAVYSIRNIFGVIFSYATLDVHIQLHKYTCAYACT